MEVKTMVFVAVYLLIGLIYTIGLLASLNRVSGGTVKEYFKEFGNGIWMKARICVGFVSMVVLWPISVIGAVLTSVLTIRSVAILRNALKEIES
jgi:hypothetical protein